MPLVKEAVLVVVVVFLALQDLRFCVHAQTQNCKQNVRMFNSFQQQFSFKYKCELERVTFPAAYAEDAEIR